MAITHVKKDAKRFKMCLLKIEKKLLISGKSHISHVCYEIILLPSSPPKSHEVSPDTVHTHTVCLLYVIHGARLNTAPQTDSCRQVVNIIQASSRVDEVTLSQRSKYYSYNATAL